MLNSRVDIVLWAVIAIVVTPTGAAGDDQAAVTGELKKWHRVTVTFTGPKVTETDEANPFRDYRLNVTFTNVAAKVSVTVPGYFAADGNAAETGAAVGDRWRAHFSPPATGKWDYVASFRTGRDVAASLDRTAGEAVAFDGARGAFTVAATDKTGRDHRAKGALRYVGKRYLQFAETGGYYLKGGADSPENFLAYAEFDDTYRIGKLRQRQGENFAEGIHRYQPHVRDWNAGDPTWRNGRGKGIIGALNYLASQEMNCVYFLTMNVAGDGKDVWPWIDHDKRDRFDCSKLDQWEIVFSHMDSLGILLHVITQEQENDQILDDGDLGIERRLYYRELIARFAHHPALVWNLGEENTNTDAQRKAFCDYIRELDAYKHPIVCHTFPGKYDEVYNPLLGYKNFDGPSLQTNDTHNQTMRWVDRSVAAGRPWVVFLDEIGPANTGVKPDADDPEHNEVRQKHLWGNLMAGGGGAEWYFGYNFAHNDLNCEDWRSRANMWKQTRVALRFFHEHVPFTAMRHADELTDAKDDYCFALPGEVYVIYLPKGGTTKLNLGEMRLRFNVLWYNPREGGKLIDSAIKSVAGPGMVSIGDPPAQHDKDWAVLITAADKPAKRAKVEVEGGVGGGEYAVGAAVPIRAVAPPGHALQRWNVEGGDAPQGAARNDPVITVPEAGARYRAVYAAGRAADRPTPRGDGKVVSFTLINADTDQPISGFDPIKPDATIRLSQLPTRNLSLRANVEGDVGAVTFDLDGQRNAQTERTPPFSLTGDTNGDYNAWTPAIGRHTVTARGGKGALTIDFTIAE